MKRDCLCTRRADIVCNDFHCDLAGPGSPYNANECRVCWNRLGKNTGFLPLYNVNGRCPHLWKRARDEAGKVKQHVCVSG